MFQFNYSKLECSVCSDKTLDKEYIRNLSDIENKSEWFNCSCETNMQNKLEVYLFIRTEINTMLLMIHIRSVYMKEIDDNITELKLENMLNNVEDNITELKLENMLNNVEDKISMLEKKLK